jgi:Mrp family chromosome partitioning ATPase
MPSEQDVMNALNTVMDPELGRSIVDLQMIKELAIDPGGKVSFTIALTVPSCPLREKIRNDAAMAVKALEGVTDLEIHMGAMSDEERKQVLGNSGQNLPKLNQFNHVDNVIAVMSGKGGVGKSSVAAMLAASLARGCQRVGILDADITGPSIPKLFGLPAGGIRSSEQGILPAVTGLGIKAISINLLVEDENAAVIWRGPMISGAITQFWTDVFWGKLDYLIVDMPPGTSDAALTVMRSLPVTGVMMVTTPQQLSAMVVRKAASMLDQLNIPVLGVVENMSYYPCPDSGKEHAIFGPSHSQEVATACKARVIARLPLDPALTEMADNGRIEDFVQRDMEKMVTEMLKEKKTGK